MLRFAADENLDGRLPNALRQSAPELDIIRIQDSPVATGDDDAVLEWAAREDRLLLTADVQTLTGRAKTRAAAGKPMPGVVALRRGCEIPQLAEDIILLAAASWPNEWEGKITYVPFS